jgi:hypothetical protein
MASGERDDDGGGKAKPRKAEPSPEGSEAATARAQPETPLEISRRGRIVLRSSSHPPGETPPYSDPPDSSPPTVRFKRDTPAERPRGRRAARAMSTSGDAALSPSQAPAASGRGTTVLWAIIVALSAALAYALMR